MDIIKLLLIIILTNIATAEIIKDIRYIGIKNTSIKEIKKITSIKKKDTLDLNKIDDSIKILFGKGEFASIKVDYNDNSILTFIFEEKEMIYDLKIKHYKTDKEHKEIFDLVNLHKGSIINQFKINEIKNLINQRLESEGYYDNYINVIFNRKNKQLKITFDVSKGKKIIISELNFIGSKGMKREVLIKNLANKSKDSFGWFPGRNSGVSFFQHFEVDKYRLQDTYMQQGFLDVNIDSSIMKVNTVVEKSKIDYILDKGKIYKVNSVKIDNLRDNYKSEIDYSKLLVKKNSIFNSMNIREDVKYIGSQISNLGFAYANIVPTFNKRRNRLVDVVYKISYNEKMVINDVIISGNDITRDNVVRRYITFAPTDIYNLTSFEQTKNTLMRTGYFSNVDIIKKRIDAKHMDIIVKVKEASTGSIRVGGGYGTYNGFLFNANVSDINIFGTGISSGVSFDISKKVTNYSFNIVNPRFMDSKYSLSFNISQNKSTFTTYVQETFSIGTSFGKSFTDSIYGYIGYNFSNNRIDNNESSKVTSGYTSAFTGTDLKYTKSSINLGLKFNNTDSYYVPRRGVIFNNYITYNGVSGDEKFIKYTSKFNTFYGVQDIINYDLIFRYRAQVNFLQDTGQISLPEKLFLGGVRSVRGFDPFSISPYRKDGNLITYLGGTKSFITSVEASIPLHKKHKIRLSLFYDYGMIGNKTFNDVKKSSYGLSVEWQSPLGPINLIFPRAINADEVDRTSKFEFTIGVGF